MFLVLVLNLEMGELKKMFIEFQKVVVKA